MGNDESPEEQLSSFAGELEDVKGMCECMESRCLFLLDGHTPAGSSCSSPSAHP